MGSNAAAREVVTAGRREGSCLEPAPELVQTFDFFKAISRNAREVEEKVFLHSADQGKQVTFGELEVWCARIARYFEEVGVRELDKISVIGKNSAETLLIYFAVLYYGGVVNPINVDESQENIYKILDVVEPRVVIYDGSIPLDTSRLEGLLWIPFTSFDAAAGRADDFFSAVADRPPRRVPPAASSQDLAEVVFTSGTTSVPKGVCITRGALYAMAYEVAEKLAVTRDDVLLEYRNYNWASAQLLTILSSVVVGTTLVLARKFSRSRFGSWLTDYGVTISAGVPTVINILAHDPVPLPNHGRANLRFMTSSSAPLSVAAQETFERIYGIPIVQMAGMTEAGFMVGNPFEGRKSGSAGTPCRFKDVHFVDQQGNRCGPGEEGEMVVRGYATGLGYLQKGGSIEPFPEQGFRTGDLGHVDAEGFVYITGRVKDLIIRGGVNIAPMEITTRILEYPLVKEAATIGVSDPIYGEEVASFVVPKAGWSIEEAEVIAHCRKSLPEFKLPKRVYVVDAIPKTARGKVSKKHLLEVLEAQEPARARETV